MPINPPWNDIPPFHISNMYKGFKNNTANLTMVLKDKYGQTTTRKIRNRTLEGINDGDKSLVIFNFFIIKLKIFQSSKASPIG